MMLSAEKNVTIVNSYYDGDLDKDVEVRTVLKGVSVFFDHSAGALSTGIHSSDTVKIRIPFRDFYLRSDLWQEKKNSRRWTLRVGDKIIVDGESKTILRFRDNTDRRFARHWFVEAQ